MTTFLAYITSGVWELLYLLKYLAAVLLDGDWLNDWLTYLPPDVATAAQVIGEWIASFNL